MLKVLGGMLRAPLDARYAGSPLAVCWFVTFSCNARCEFCCKTAELHQGRNEFPPLSISHARTLLAKIRSTVDLLYLSGGEPLTHPEIEAILAEARIMKFRSIGMSSNIIDLHRRAGVLDYLDILSISIHDPDVVGHARSLSISEAAAGQVFENLEIVRRHAMTGRLRVIINCVITRQNLDRVSDMVEFAAKRGFLLEVVPANDHGGIESGLLADPRYARMIQFLLDLRRSGRAPHLAGSTAYYRRLQTLQPFRCFPYGIPNIMPDGRLCTPCDVSGQHDLNILEFADLGSAVRASRNRLGKFPCRQGRCFKAGILERSRLFGVLCRSVSSG